MNESRIRFVDGIRVPTEKTDIWSANGIEVEVGTNGYQGGDSGHGCRTIFRFSDLGGTDLKLYRINSRETGANGGVQILLGGDCELLTFIEALKFAVKTLEEQTKNSSDDDYICELH